MRVTSILQAREVNHLQDTNVRLEVSFRRISVWEFAFQVIKRQSSLNFASEPHSKSRDKMLGAPSDCDEPPRRKPDSCIAKTNG